MRQACGRPGTSHRLLTGDEPIPVALRGCLQEVPVGGAAAALAACEEQALQLPLHTGHAQHPALHPVAHCRHLQAARGQGGVSCSKPASSWAPHPVALRHLQAPHEGAQLSLTGLHPLIHSRDLQRAVTGMSKLGAAQHLHQGHARHAVHPLAHCMQQQAGSEICSPLVCAGAKPLSCTLIARLLSLQATQSALCWCQLEGASWH